MGHLDIEFSHFSNFIFKYYVQCDLKKKPEREVQISSCL